MRLLIFLFLAYALSYLLAIPIHHDPIGRIIPAAVPWAIGAVYAIICVRRGTSLWPAWALVVASAAFFALGHVVHR